MKEGFRRLALAFSAIAWVILIGTFIGSAWALLTSEREWWIAISVGAVFFAILQGSAWIIAGFAGADRAVPGIIRASDIVRWCCRDGRDQQ